MKFPIPGMLISGPAGEGSLLLEEVLGHGAFGVVFKAKETASGTPYAVKFPQVPAFGGEEEVAAFLNEVQAAQEIQHLNVVRVVRVETDPAELPPYLVMEFVEGGTLRARLDHLRSLGEMVDMGLLQRWTDGLVDGIAAINEKMLHRDLKPDNILMDDDTPKIGDFGLSKIVGAMTRTRTFKGGQQIFYMAPEGWKLETNEIQIDMYSMGIVLYEIASLRYPYEVPSDSLDIESIRNMHLYQQPKPLRQVRPDIPIGFSQVVSRLVEKRPQDRFSNWSEVKEALDHAWSDHESEASGAARLVTSLLGETERLHDDRTRQRIEKEKRDAEQEERRRLDEFQMKRLIDALRQVVSQFNERSSLGKIEMQENLARRHCQFRLPFGSTITLGFDWIETPLNLKVGEVRFFGLMEDPANGAGLNYLLCRSGESDLYGTWRVCRVRQSPLVDPRKMPRRV